MKSNVTENNNLYVTSLHNGIHGFYSY